MGTRKVLAVLAVLACGAGAACKASAPAAPPAERGADCRAVQAEPEADLVAWDAAARKELDRLRRQGVVAVRYEANGCDVSLELIPRCVGPKDRYVWSPHTASETKIARDVGELYARFPIGATSLADHLKERRAIRADFKLVGSVGLPSGSTVTEYDLVGPECRRATHIVSAVYLGGFAMAALRPADVANATNLFGKAGPAPEGVAREGQPEICERAGAEGLELGGCSVPLRVVLLPLGGAAAAPVCPAAHTWNGTRCVKTEAPAEECADGGEGGCAEAAEADGGARPVFDQIAIERVTLQHQASIRRTCWETVTESLKRITVSVAVRVDTQGRVTQADAQVTDSDGPVDVAGAVGRCIANEIRGWKFPEPDTEKVMSLPFHLIRQ